MVQMNNYETQIQLLDSSAGPIYLQLVQQLKILIDSGMIKKGNQLPNRYSLANQLNVNVNTIHRVYRILEMEGYTVAKRGKGTFVSRTLVQENSASAGQQAYNIVHQALTDCKLIGISAERFMSIARMVVTDFNMNKITAAMVECHQSWLIPIAEKIQNELNIPVDPYLLSDVRSEKDDIVTNLMSYDLIITSHSHFEELNKIIGNKKEITTIAIYPPLDTIVSLAKTKAKKALVPFLSKDSIERIEFAFRAMGLDIDLAPIDIENEKQKKKLASNGVLLVPESDLEKLKNHISKDIKIVTLTGHIGEDVIEHLRQKISTITKGSIKSGCLIAS